MFTYPVTLTPEGGGFVVTFPDVPAAITEGDDEEEALAHAVDALESALSMLIDDRKDIPLPSQVRRRQKSVSLPPMSAAKVALYRAITPEMFAGSPAEQAYLALAPNPGDFPLLVGKIVAMLSTPHDVPADAIRAISAPTLIVVGDADLIRPEHAVELFGLLGGGAIGDLAELPQSRLAVLPGTSHLIPPGSGVLDRAPLLHEMIVPFLREGPAGR